MKNLTFLVLAFSTSLFATTANAGVLLTDLIGGTDLTVGDKVFTNWSATVNGDGITLANISIEGDNSNPLNPGLVYSITNGALTADVGDFFDLDISFTVSTLSGQPYLIGTSLEFDSTGASTGASMDGLVSILDTHPGVLGAGAPEIFIDSLRDESQLSDSLSFDAVASRKVNLNLLVFNSNADVVSLTEFRQNFAQSQSTVQPVPEPASLATWSLLGLVGLRYSRRRVQRSSAA